MADLHVAVLIPGFKIFGQERALINVSETLRQNGVAVTILLHESWGRNALAKTVEERGFRSYSLPLNTIWSIGILLKSPRDLIGNLVGLRASSRRFSEIVSSENIDVLIAGNWSFLFYLLPALRKHDLGVIYRHGDSPPVSNPLSRWMAKTVFERANVHVANCEFLRRQVEELCAIDDVTLIRNHPVGLKTINVPSGCPDQTANRLVYAGQMSEHKGVIKLLDAFDILAVRHSSLELALAGVAPGVKLNVQDPVMSRLEASIARWGDRVQYLGYTDNVGELFTDRSIHVCPSIWDDPSPNIIHEAKARAVPTVAFARGGIPELIRSGIDGEVVTEETAQQLAAAISSLIDRPDTFSQARIEARESLDMFFDFDKYSHAWSSVVGRAARHLVVD